MPLSSRRPPLTERLTAFSIAVSTVGVLVGEEFFDLTDARVQAAIINAAAALVVGADLKDVATTTDREDTDANRP